MGTTDEVSSSDPRLRAGERGPVDSDGGCPLTQAALDLFPAAVAVADSRRRLVSWNRRYENELGGAGATTCCELIGCLDPGGPTGGRCVTDIVRFGQGPWRGEVRPGGGAAQQVVATGSGAFVTLQFEEIEDLDEPDGEGLRVFCLGSLRLGQQDESPEWLEQRPGLLLKYLLVMRHRPVRPEEIVESLWPGSLTAGPGTVRYIVHQLRRRLEPHLQPGDASRWILHTPRGYQLDLSRVWVDADAYETVVRTAVAAAVRGDTREAEQAAARAVALYRDDFLRDDPYEEWTLAERDRLHDMLETPLGMLIDARLAAGDLEGAAAYAARLARHDPLDADVQRLALGIWLRQGKQGRALRHYDLFCTRLRRTLGQPPPFALADLADLGQSHGPEGLPH